MKTLNVAAAVIMHEGKIFAAERGYGTHAGWEFPGGKIRENEMPEEALKREILEELGCEIETDRYLMKLEHDYDDFHLSMDVYLCHITNGTIILKEHRQARWADLSDLDHVPWLQADAKIIPVLKQALQQKQEEPDI